MKAGLTIVSITALLGLLTPPAASAQVNVVGYWNPLVADEDFIERVPGPNVGDYAGLPITDAARKRANTWDAGLLTLPEHQCKPHPSTYGFRGVGVLRIWEERNPRTQQLVRIKTHIQWQEQERDIWMDGRPQPSELEPHTWQGFSTGRFEGDVLVVRTTHLKAGWIRRNGLPLSDAATMTERFLRHGDLLTHVMMLEDPVYLSEPLVKTNGFAVAPTGTMEPYPCRPAVEVPREPSATARVFRFADGAGEIGFINPVSEPFCADCNRLRLTAEGKLRTCLFSIHETDLREPLRTGASDADLEEIIRDAVWRKELKHHVGEPGFRPPPRSMSAIGG